MTKKLEIIGLTASSWTSQEGHGHTGSVEDWSGKQTQVKIGMVMAGEGKIEGNQKES